MRGWAVLLIAGLLCGCGLHGGTHGLASKEPASAVPSSPIPGTPDKPPVAKGEPPLEVGPSDSGFTLMTLNMVDKADPNVLFDDARRLTPLDASPDGRYLLVGLPVSEAGASPQPAIVDVDAQTTMLVDSAVLPSDKAAWSGQGFWIGPLVHVDLDLRVNRYEGVRATLGLDAEKRVIAFDAAADRMVLMTVPQHVDLKVARFWADVVVLDASGAIRYTFAEAVQPWLSTGLSALVRISPDGKRAVILAGNPEAALIRLDAADRSAWVPLAGAAPSQPLPVAKLAKSTGLPPIWSPDSRHVWLPTGHLVASGDDGHPVIKGGDWSILWFPDGQSVLTKLEQDRYQRTWLNGTSETVELPVGFVPIRVLQDGRLLGYRRH